MARHAASETMLLEEPPMYPVEEPLPILGTVLGAGVVESSEAVRAHLDEGHLAYTAGDRLQAARAKAAARAENDQVLDELGSLRTTLAELPPASKGIMEGYLRKHFDDDPMATGHETLVDWLADGTNGAKTSVLFGFLRDHVRDVAAKQQSPEVRYAVARVKGEYLAAEEQAVKDGWLSTNALRKMEDIEPVKVYVGDLWDTIVRGMPGVLAYHQYGTDYITISPPVVDSNEPITEKIRDSAPHEFNHVQLFGNWYSRWLNEALTEHVQLALRYGDPFTVDPAARMNDHITDPQSRAYEPERKLLDTLLHAGPERIGTWLATKAYSADGPESPEARNFMERMDAVWKTDNMLGTVASRIKEQEAAFRAANPDAHRRTTQTTVIAMVQQEIEQRATFLQYSKQQAVGAVAVPATGRHRY